MVWLVWITILVKPQAYCFFWFESSRSSSFSSQSWILPLSLTIPAFVTWEAVSCTTTKVVFLFLFFKFGEDNKVFLCWLYFFYSFIRFSSIFFLVGLLFSTLDVFSSKFYFSIIGHCLAMIMPFSPLQFLFHSIIFHHWFYLKLKFIAFKFKHNFYID